MEFKTACGKTIIVSDQTVEHLKAHEGALELLEEAIGKITIPEGGFLLTTLDMGRVIGRSSLVDAPQVTATETATFACRVGRDIPSRVLVGVEKPETNLFTVIAGLEDGAWQLYTSFVGPSAPREPHDRNLKNGNADELAFWCEHALVHEDGWQTPFESTWTAVVEQVVAARAAKV